MSWLARSIANSLRLDEDGGEDAAAVAVDVKKPVEDAVPRPTGNDDAVLPEDRSPESAFSIEDRRSDSEGGASDNHGVEEEDGDGDYDQGRGVKEDLSEFRESLTRQFWGVASFLAPPPPPPPLPPPLYERSSVRLKADPAGSADADADEGEEEELVEYDEDERESGELGESANLSPSKDYVDAVLEEAVGITEEVLAFARNIAHHPETWLDFPIEEEEFDGKEA